ncbi:MAG: hypothetical protein A3J07_02720 [Candidatus Doudnabacteria bacterium RIFCSPLOWO2_02_FULL_49_13]|uniref:PNPLA domain-containing protein n=1 Tax=Candidatus Doudnabacteria bacterium RIFCSPHIGHO2_12_FULL_48_16 TaxID=1817838 RepID=A0A1F5PLQ5_9BACT|nr:MAG: hypothetical protein A3B77_01365 [Candidatus Doudnabacteria bacterium RIFCSPHIGHO2_02_FULL_49_24]OGE89292.1 MAG: hypothetical protein A2760_03060 [Candidatus Doudnabacteria bacterium RIFCSPHIGHO2_01_FULL_50_67]OGE90592.1 MAG: hypothetical protein A3E29_02235 [Candidatus Doudnabacteria bacterium RIFCSPHIGHO2_12_FULL_48_16]OGE97629.1 MAG: hypothetical protein A2990_03290 [Candidatus Doudnabacteria bacterium RIFCSPLOWO2_01_FULL_49_40]OGF02984.1 MAG: hypothetical protein A3J07_02720 [Candid
MHPALEHINARRNKKVPLKDGRRIVLLVFGGVMSGMRGSGALIGLQQLGLTHAFDEIYSMSAGFPNACYFLADDPDKGPSIYYEELAGRKFINASHPWNLMDIDYLIDVFKNKKPLPVDKVLASKTKLFVIVKNLGENKIEYLEVHKVGSQNFFNLMKAAISAPFLHPGSTKLGHSQYKDPLMWSVADYQWQLDQILKTKATDILVIYNNNSQYLAPALFSDRVYEIMPPAGESNGLLETRPEVLKQERDEMIALVKQLLG